MPFSMYLNQSFFVKVGLEINVCYFHWSGYEVKGQIKEWKGKLETEEKNHIGWIWSSQCLEMGSSNLWSHYYKNQIKLIIKLKPWFSLEHTPLSFILSNKTNIKIRLIKKSLEVLKVLKLIDIRNLLKTISVKITLRLLILKCYL